LLGVLDEDEFAELELVELDVLALLLDELELLLMFEILLLDAVEEATELLELFMLLELLELAEVLEEELTTLELLEAGKLPDDELFAGGAEFPPPPHAVMTIAAVVNNIPRRPSNRHRVIL